MAWFDAGVNMFDARMPVEETLREAAIAGVEKICLITTHPDEWQEAQNLHKQYPDRLCYTLGIHPHNAKDASPEHWDLLREMALSQGVVAIGECGLDYNRDFSPRDVQRTVFKQQLQIACEVDKPVYLHERDAFDDQLACLAPFVKQLKGGLAHCFTGDSIQMKAYLDLGLYIGVTGWVCDPERGEKLREALKSLPQDKLILETDAPYLYPKTRKPRARNNSPAYLPYIGQTVAELKGLDPKALENVCYANTTHLFG